MALFENLAKGIGGANTGAMAGIGVLILAPFALRVVGRLARPVAGRALQSGIVLYRRAREGAEDLIAECRDEMEGTDAVSGGATRRALAGPARQTVLRLKPPAE